MWERKLNFLDMHFECNCMLFCQVNCATPLDKSLNSPWGPLCRWPPQARTSVTPLSLSHAPQPIETQAVNVSIPKANDVACICLCLHIDFFILYVCSRTWKSSWLLAIISKMWSHPCLAPPTTDWHPPLCCDHLWLVLNATMIVWHLQVLLWLSSCYFKKDVSISN